ncbi:hypothetical protein [Pseudomonas helleri]|uniref:hypothetical protein n=1 Tax=Pseudomonas helleri TaxID=1608996 RepID=UPI003F97861D
MEITFSATHASVEPGGRNVLDVTVVADGAVIAEQLSDADRLHDLDVDVVRAWLLLNDNHDDILEAVGLDKIHEFLSHAE